MKQVSKRSYALGLLFVGSIASAQTKVGGYVAPMFSWGSSKTSKTNTFQVPEGAVYFSHSMDMAQVMVDIPFSATSSTSNNLSIGGDRAQAYIAHKWEMGLSWRLGQFDGIYGYLNNDLVDQAFASRSGLRDSTLMPKTHTGLLFNYAFSDMLGLNVVFANPMNMSSRPVAVKADGSADSDSTTKYDMGLQVTSNVDAFKFGVGWLMHRGTKAVGNSNMFDVTAGTAMGDLKLDADLVFSKAKDVDADMGFGVQGIFAINEMASAGARVEWVKFGATDTKMLGLTVGPQFALSKALNLRVDYTMGNSKVGSGTSSTTHAINLAGVYRF